MLHMELSYAGMRHRAVPLLFWVGIGFGLLAMVLPWTTPIPAPAAVVLLVLAAGYKLWIQWQNGRGGFGAVRGLRPTYETRARLSPGQWFLLLLFLVLESTVLAFVLIQ